MQLIELLRDQLVDLLVAFGFLEHLLLNLISDIVHVLLIESSGLLKLLLPGFSLVVQINLEAISFLCQGFSNLHLLCLS